METRANYVLVGLFTLITALGLLGFGLWAAKYSSDRTWQNYRIIFSEAVTGLSQGSTVLYNGLAVGSVTHLALDSNDPRQVIAHIRLIASTPVKTDTRARIAITSLTGPAMVQLTGGSPQAPALVTVIDDPAPIIQTAPSTLQNITEVAKSAVERLDELLSARNIARISAVLGHLEGISATLDDPDHGIAALLGDTRQTIRRLDQTLATAHHSLQHLDQQVIQPLPLTLEKLNTTLDTLDALASQASNVLDENQAAIHHFANDGLSQLGPTLIELRELIEDLRRVSDRLDDNPARYLLGKDTPKEFAP